MHRKLSFIVYIDLYMYVISAGVIDLKICTMYICHCKQYTQLTVIYDILTCLLTYLPNFLNAILIVYMNQANNLLQFQNSLELF